MFNRATLTFSISAITALAMLTGCYPHPDAPDQVAVASMPVEERQAINFLALNDDKPGAFVTVQRYLVPGKYTIIHFYSPYDGESAGILPQLAQLAQTRSDIAVRTVNVNRPEIQGVDIESPALEGTEVQKLPYFQIYDPQQRLRAQARPAYEQISQWIRPAAYRP